MSPNRPDPQKRSFPAVGDDDRFDQIVRRGRSLRRRRQVGIAAGSGGGVAAVAVAVVLLTGGSPRPDQTVVADQNRTTVEAPTTSTTSTTQPPVTPPDELTLEVDAGADEITVVVTDPRAPVADGARQCVTVTLMGDKGDTAETTACDDIPAVDGVVTVDLPSTGGSLIGCAATLLPPGDDTSADFDTELRSTTFVLPLPSDLAPDTYSVEVGATSGVGDGCPDTGDEAPAAGPFAPGATETATRADATFTLG